MKNSTKVLILTQSVSHDEGIITILIHILSFHVAITVLCFGFLGNTLAVLTMSFMKQSVVGFHFRTLAIADMAASTTMIQQIVLITAPESLVPWGQVFCMEYWFIGFLTYGITYWCLATLTMDRVVAVCFPMKAAVWCTMKRARYMLGANVLCHCVLYATNLWRDFYPPDPANPSHFSMCRVPQVFPSWYPIFEELKYQGFDVYAPPFVVLLGNVSIMRAMHQNRKVSSGLKRTVERREGNMAVMLISVSIMFILLVSAYPLDFIYWEVYNPNHNTPDLRSLSFTAANVIAQLNSSVNFYIYLLASSQFRKDFKLLCYRGIRFIGGQ